MYRVAVTIVDAMDLTFAELAAVIPTTQLLNLVKCGATVGDVGGKWNAYSLLAEVYSAIGAPFNSSAESLGAAHVANTNRLENSTMLSLQVNNVAGS